MSREADSGSSLDTAERRRRLVDADSFGFVKDPSCRYECGAVEGLDVDQCGALGTSGEVVAVQCKMQFYARNSACDYECGNRAYNEDALPPDQCYNCYTTLRSCAEGYYEASHFGCCRRLTCPAIADTTVKSSPSLTWNLEEETITESVITLYKSGDCSDPDDPSSNCCRITCNDCFVKIDIVSLYVGSHYCG
jgi:hypothetical protein